MERRALAVSLGRRSLAMPVRMRRREKIAAAGGGIRRW
jgi:hypothetical protein